LRKTILTLEELIHVVETNHMAHCAGGQCAKCNKDTRLPAGLVANELGVILLETSDKRAENALLKLLISEYKAAQLGAFIFLAMASGSPEVTTALSKFSQNPENKDVCRQVKNYLSAAITSH